MDRNGLRPSGLPQLRQQLIEMGTKHLPEIYRWAIISGNQAVRPPGTPSAAANLLAEREVTRLRMAELYWVSEEMTDLADVAGGTMPGFTLEPDDLPSEFGLIVFERPLAANGSGVFAERFSEPVQIIGATWGPWQPTDGSWPNSGVWITWYADTGKRIAVEAETQAPFTSEAVPAEGGDIYQTAFRTLKATWLLMQQEGLTATTTERPPRAAQRRLDERHEDLMRVRVIRLRRAHGVTRQITESREYRHRWIVRGHWRQQWYAHRQVHRPVWISPHMKGPDNAPLIGGEKVYAWVK